MTVKVHALLAADEMRRELRHELAQRAAHWKARARVYGSPDAIAVARWLGIVLATVDEVPASALAALAQVPPHGVTRWIGRIGFRKFWPRDATKLCAEIVERENRRRAA